MSDNIVIYICCIILKLRIMDKIVLGIYKILKLKMVFEYYENLLKVFLYFLSYFVLFINFKGNDIFILFVFCGRKGNVNNFKIFMKKLLDCKINIYFIFG